MLQKRVPALHQGAFAISGARAQKCSRYVSEDLTNRLGNKIKMLEDRMRCCGALVNMDCFLVMLSKRMLKMNFPSHVSKQCCTSFLKGGS